jgi:hypothetical protein
LFLPKWKKQETKRGENKYYKSLAKFQGLWDSFQMRNTHPRQKWQDVEPNGVLDDVFLTKDNAVNLVSSIYEETRSHYEEGENIMRR